jgi:hypothetical protein
MNQPKHYKLETVLVDHADSRLDANYELGWRVVHMALHPDGMRITLLMERKRLPDQASADLLSRTLNPPGPD